MSTGLTRNVVVFVVLLALLAATATVHRFELGVWNVVLNLGIATLKAVLIAVFYMNLRSATGLVRLYAVVGLVWLAVLFTLTFADYGGRAAAASGCRCFPEPRPPGLCAGRWHSPCHSPAVGKPAVAEDFPHVQQRVEQRFSRAQQRALRG